MERLALKEKGISILIAGPSSDSVLAQQLTVLDNVVDICGRYTISELAAIHRGAICSLAVDGGAAHLAGFSGGNVISLSNGGEEPGVVTPVGANVIEHRNLTACTPCFGMDKCPLGHSSCVRDIEVDEVLKSILAFIDESFYAGILGVVSFLKIIEVSVKSRFLENLVEHQSRNREARR